MRTSPLRAYFVLGNIKDVGLILFLWRFRAQVDVHLPARAS